MAWSRYKECNHLPGPISNSLADSGTPILRTGDGAVEHQTLQMVKHSPSCDMSCCGRNNHPKNSEVTTRSVPQERGPSRPVANEGQDPETDDHHDESNSPADQTQFQRATPIPAGTHRQAGSPPGRPARHPSQTEYPPQQSLVSYEPRIIGVFDSSRDEPTLVTTESSKLS